MNSASLLEFFATSLNEEQIRKQLDVGTVNNVAKIN